VPDVTSPRQRSVSAEPRSTCCSLRRPTGSAGRCSVRCDHRGSCLRRSDALVSQTHGRVKNPLTARVKQHALARISCMPATRRGVEGLVCRSAACSIRSTASSSQCGKKLCKRRGQEYQGLRGVRRVDLWSASITARAAAEDAGPGGSDVGAKHCRGWGFRRGN
jgi:hypothetical protein